MSGAVTPGRQIERLEELSRPRPTVIHPLGMMRPRPRSPDDDTVAESDGAATASEQSRLAMKILRRRTTSQAMQARAGRAEIASSASG
jgi:hypothetical protein